MVLIKSSWIPTRRFNETFIKLANFSNENPEPLIISIYHYSGNIIESSPIIWLFVASLSLTIKENISDKGKIDYTKMRQKVFFCGQIEDSLKIVA